VTLRVRYDDGFIAYLNGQEIARRNFTGTPQWNSAADGHHASTAAAEFEEIPVANYRSLLGRGANLLAVHAMNTSAEDSDFLISVELAAEEILRPPTGSQISRYTAPVALTRSAQVRARLLTNAGWSALNEAVFAVGPVVENLRISEIMYHPAPMGHPDDPNSEYIELMNIGTQTIDLSLVRFTDGVEFTFPPFELVPAGYCLVVRDLAAFEARYGPDLPVAGQYTGSLNNAGEQIELQDAAGWTIHSFRYRDDWYDSTDGGGFSLTAADPVATDPNALDNRAAWRPSTVRGGSPGAGDMAYP
jgi:hypothetical protein